MTQKININEKFSKFSEHWRPKIVAELNGQEFKLAKIKGEYPFHAHEGEDEIVVKAHELLRRRSPRALMILIPRHPDRAEPDAKLR